MPAALCRLMVGVLSKQRRPVPAAPCPVNGSATVAGNGEGENPNCHRPLVGHSFKIHFPMGSWGGGGQGGSGMRRMRGSRSGDREQGALLRSSSAGLFPAHRAEARGAQRPRSHGGTCITHDGEPSGASPRVLPGRFRTTLYASSHARSWGGDQSFPVPRATRARATPAAARCGSRTSPSGISYLP